MQNQAMESDLHSGGLPHIRNTTGPKESPSRLEFMVVFLLENNERMRQQLAERSNQGRP
jgi:hypothetical protein